MYLIKIYGIIGLMQGQAVDVTLGGLASDSLGLDFRI